MKAIQDEASPTSLCCETPYGQSEALDPPGTDDATLLKSTMRLAMMPLSCLAVDDTFYLPRSALPRPALRGATLPAAAASP